MTEPAPPRRPAGLRIGSVVGVPILITRSWFLLPAYLILFGQRVLADRVGPGEAYGLALAFAGLLLLSVLLHEIGHAVVARAFDLPVRSITVNLLAGYTEITEQPQTPFREYAVAITGPMVSVLLTSISFAAGYAFADDSLPRLLLFGSAICNGAIAGLNLLPGLPLDGGRVLRSVVWQLTQDEHRATRASARAGIGIALAVPVVLVSAFPGDDAREQLITVVLALAVSAVIYLGAAQSLRRAQIESVLPAVTVAALARPALPVTANTPLSEAVRYAHERQIRALVVVDANGRLEGIVSESWVRGIPIDRRPWVVVADGARRIEQGLLLDPALAGEELLAFMNATPASEYVVRGPQPSVVSSVDVAAAMSAS